CELRDLGEPYGIEIQFLLNKALLFARRFEQGMDLTRIPREMAVAWAEEERKHLEAGGCARCQGAGWTCEQHPDRPWPHDDCPGPGEPCSARNVSDPPDKPPDFVSYVNASDPFYTPGSIPPATKARPAGPLWTIRRGDHTIACELRYH